VVASAGDGEEATRLALQYRPDVVLMDPRMPRCDGVTATRQILQELPHTGGHCAHNMCGR
jgi:chemotaxis response regulator CheB